MAKSPVELSEAAAPEPGSIAYVATRLALWGRRAPKGLARVEYDSEFSRQAVVSALQMRLADANIPFSEIKLPLFTPAPQIVLYLKEQFAALPPGVVSVSDWATAFPPDVPLEDSLRVLNYNRENVTQYPLCQIWWLTRPFADTFIRSIPDLNSWFIVRLDLTEAIVQPFEKANLRIPLPQLLPSEEAVEVETARTNSADYVARLHKAVQSHEGAPVCILLANTAVGELYNAKLVQEASELAEALLETTITVARSFELYKHYSREAFNNISTWETVVGAQCYYAHASFDDLAFLYNIAGRTSVAEEFYKTILTKGMSELGAHNLLIYYRLTQLASLLRKQERYEEAASYYKSMISKPNKGVFSSYLMLANESNDLAEIYCLQGKYAEAEATLIKALATQKTKLGTNAPQEFMLLVNLANLYKTLGRMEEVDMYQARIDAISILAKEAVHML